VEVTELIQAARAGDQVASDQLFAQVYQDLRRIAAGQVRGQFGLGATSLVHEAYFKLARPEAMALNDRQHFFAVAALAMRQIVINHVRDAMTQKRGGGVAATTLGAADRMVAESESNELIALDAALDQLAVAEPRLAKLVELRFFGGMTLDEAGAVVGLSPTTLKRDWSKARAFLHASISSDPA
jgi:RNA polymerase sigma factor (TIGR02999 family)